MRFDNEKQKGLFIFACILLVISIDLCRADKNKHKHDKNKPPKHENKNENHQQHHKKNSTVDHHQNHTASHHASGNHSSHDGHAPDIGWSLHNNPGQPAPAGNPHGYAVQHHNPGHVDQSHQGHHQQPPQQVAHPNQGHHEQPPQQVTQPQGSGPSALGAGIGGLALGALGGAAGGYFLSNALNKDDKDEEKHADNETTLITETTLAALNVLNIENSTEIVGDSTITLETTAQPLNITMQNLPIEVATEKPSEVIAEQKITEAQVTTPGNSTENTTEKSSSEINKISIFTFIACFVAINRI